MAKNNDALFYAIVAGAALFVYMDAKKSITGAFKQPTYTREQSTSLYEKAGYKVLGSGAQTRVEVPGGVVYIPEASNLRRWETSLLIADRFVPGTWLSRSVLS